LRLASIFHSGLIPLETVKITGDCKTGLDVLVTDASSLVQPDDIVCNSVTVKNTLYLTNMLVVLQVINQDRIVAGWIRKIIVKKKEVFLLVTTKMCRRTKMRYFESGESQGGLKLKNIANLKSFKPLIPRGTEASYVFFLHGKLLDDFAQ
jgi:hypothetical protein